MTNAETSVLTVVAIAVAFDVVVGEVPNRVHPVVGIGTLIDSLRRRAPSGALAQLVYGLGLVVVVLGVTVGAVFIVRGGLEHLFHLLAQLTPSSFDQIAGSARMGVEGLLLSTLFALRGLITAGVRMRRALGTSVAAGRDALCHLCSRDASTLDQHELCGATIESLSENTSDSFVAPLLWYVSFEGSLGLGLYAAALYRAINTMDAMIGYRGKYQYIGKTAARLDDVVNWVPARLTAVLLIAAATLGARFGFNPTQSARVAWRDHGLTDSPNAGWPMAAAAGALDVELAKRDQYTLGASLSKPEPSDIAACERLVLIAACVCLVAIALSQCLWSSHD